VGGGVVCDLKTERMGKPGPGVGCRPRGPGGGGVKIILI